MGEVGVEINGYEHATAGGLVAVYSSDEAAGARVHASLSTIQQRGTMAVGEALAVYNEGRDGDALLVGHEVGHVSALNRFQIINSSAHIALGHVRSERIPGVSDASDTLPHVQPYYYPNGKQEFAFASNGHFSNVLDVSRELGFDYSEAGLPTNSGFMARLISDVSDRSGEDLEQTLGELLPLFRGSPYSFGLITPQQLIAGMGNGIQPLILGMGEGRNVYMATETQALDVLGTEFQRSFEPGETIVVEKNKYRQSTVATVGMVCIREFTDYALDSSRMTEAEYVTARQEVGAKLAEEAPVEGAELVLGVPERGAPIGLTYAQKLGAEYSSTQIIKSRYHGGTRRPTTIEEHEERVWSNYNLADPESVEGKVVVVVDNRMSTKKTMEHIVKLLNKAGAREVHLRFGTPLNENTCGVGKHAEASNNGGIEGATSIKYLSLKGFVEVVRPHVNPAHAICTFCIDGAGEK